MAANSTDFAKLNELNQQKERLEQQLSEKMERWEYLMNKAEQIAQQKSRDLIIMYTLWVPLPRSVAVN